MVKRPGRGGQVWSMEKLDNKLVDMRDMYEDWRRRQQKSPDADVEEVHFIYRLLKGSKMRRC